MPRLGATRRAALPILVGALLVFGAGCGGDETEAPDTTAVSTTATGDEPMVIEAKLMIAATENSEPIATGTILSGSVLGGLAFCAGGTIRDTHASVDPEMAEYLIDRTITCPDGTVRMGLTPNVGAATQSESQTGSWTIVSGTGAFEGLSGKGTSEGVYGESPESPVRETLTGTAKR